MNVYVCVYVLYIYRFLATKSLIVNGGTKQKRRRAGCGYVVGAAGASIDGSWLLGFGI